MPKLLLMVIVIAQSVQALIALDVQSLFPLERLTILMYVVIPCHKMDSGYKENVIICSKSYRYPST